VRSIVCIKRVPDSEARIRVLEEALRLKEGAGEGSVTAMTLGSADAAETLRSALAMGADDGVLLKAEGSPDGLAVARALAAEIESRDYDLLLFGKQAIDDDNMQVPAMVAELLDLPVAAVVVELEIDGGSASAKREVEGGHEIVTFDLPGVVSAQKGLNEPRYPSLKGIMAAKKKPIEEKEVELPAATIELFELTRPPARPEPQIVGEGPDAVPELVRRLREEAKVL
jgi:electron transfer flavoprotein beta subunit